MNEIIEHKYCVYVHTNKINQKKYVGITSQKPEKRWNNGWGYLSQPFFNAIKKYGWENFEHEIIANNLSLEEAKKLESSKIIEFNCFIDKNGYNVIYFDEADYSTHNSTNKPIYQFDIYGNFIKEYNSISSISALYNIKPSMISVACKRSPFYYCKGYIWRFKEDIDDIEDFISSFNFRIFDSHYSVYQFDLNGNYINSYKNSIEASKDNPECYSVSILDCCRNKYKKAGDYVWKFQIDVPNIEDFSKNFKFDNSKKEHINPVLQFDLDGNFIKKYKNLKEAASSMNCCTQLISYACIQKIQKAKEYLWRYEKDYNGEKLQYIPYAPNTKTVYQFDMNYNLINTFKSAQVASDNTNIPRHDIISACNKKQNTAYGYIWSYENIPDYNIKPKERKISQYTINGEYVKSFNSIADAAKFYNYNLSAISSCCKGRSKTSYGYIWKYDSEEGG